MLARLLQLRKALTTVLGGEGMPNTINSCEWSMIHEYCTALKLFKDATHVLTIEDAPTLSRCIPAIYGMKETLMAIIAKDNTPNTLQFTKNLLIEINRRFDFIENSKTLILAMLMDPPRVKDRLLSAEKKREALVILESVASNYMVQVTEISTESTEIQEISEPSPSESESLFTFLNNISEHEEISYSDMLKKGNKHLYCRKKYFGKRLHIKVMEREFH